MCLADMHCSLSIFQRYPLLPQHDPRLTVRCASVTQVSFALTQSGVANLL